ncbi:hypothetical protein BD410DRAFT_695097, partial [Rickenella mellea]
LYDQDIESQQVSAASQLGAYGLDFAARESLDDRWSVKWRDSSGKGMRETCRVLLQCDCGYNHEAAGSKIRRNAVNFTGCLGHAEITYNPRTERVLRIRGYFEHNEECKKAVLARIPPIPLHPSVYEVALQQLKDGATLTDIQVKNREMMNAQRYRNQPVDTAKSPYRWILKQADTRSLYRQFNRIGGISVSKPAHVNIHNWLDPHSPEYNAALHRAIFHYSERATRGDRFEVCVATKEMLEAAWTYGHQSQIMLDGTFGVCDRKILLFIVMAIDENRHGVPLAFFFFSAPSGNKHTAAGYNTDIIAKLLKVWQDSLGQRSGGTFEALVAITDTDLIERAALLRVFPGIWLLICKFHLRHRLKRLEDALVQTVSIDNAHAILEKEIIILGSDPASEAAQKGLVHLTYLRDYWSTEILWRSWSDFGRRVAAAMLKCPVEGILTTTNHLESFNGLLKRKHLRRWQRGNRRLRLDVLLNLVITKVLPSIFDQRAMDRAENLRWEMRIRALRGGEALLSARNKPAIVLPSVAYLKADPTRHEAAISILNNKQISAPDWVEKKNKLIFTCYSSVAVAADTDPTIYNLWLGFDGMAHCECQDFGQRGGACKHIRAAVLRVSELRLGGIPIPAIPIPESEEDARKLQQDHLAQILSATTTPHSNLVRQAACVVEDVLRETELDTIAVRVPEGQTADGAEGVEDDDGSESDSSESDAAGDDFDFTILRASGRAAVDEQAVARVFYELEGAGAKLRNLSTFLKDVSMQKKDLRRAITFRDQLGSLFDELTRMISNVKISEEDKAEPAHQHTNNATAHPTRPSTPPNTSESS